LLLSSGDVAEHRSRSAGGARQTLNQRREHSKLLLREGLLAQEVLIANIQTSLGKFALNLPCRLLRLKALKVEALLLTTKVPQKLRTGQLLPPGIKVQAEASLTELLLSPPCSVLLLLGVEAKLRCTLARLLSGLEALNLKLTKTTRNICAHAKGTLPELLCGLLEAFLSRTALKAKLRRLKLSRTIRFKGLLRLPKGLLATASLNVAKLLTEIPLSFGLHDGFAIPAQRALRRRTLTNLAAHDVGLATSLPRLDVRNHLLVGVHVALER
jgi:hypothetical protein